MPPSIHQCDSSGPIAAVALPKLGKQILLLAGEGHLLRVFDENARILCKIQVFHAQAIHGIECREQTSGDGDCSIQCLIWGARSLRLADLKLCPDQIICTFPTNEIIVNDWIVDVAFPPTLDADAVLREAYIAAVLLTSYNVLLSLWTHCDATDVDKSLVLPVAAGPSSVLYSGHVIWQNDSQILVAAGTVFGEVQLWTVAMTSECQHNTMITGTMLQCFSGHDGSVFGVRMSDEVGSHNGQHYRVLASCSDDRTIRVWDISDLLSLKKGLVSIGVKQSGFGSVAHQGLGRFLYSGSGHQSRIWGIRFLQSDGMMQNLLSYGEDSTVYLWQFAKVRYSQTRVEAERSQQLQPKGTLAHHIGKNIWSSAVANLGEGSYLMVTGGADGSMVLSHIFARGSLLSSGRRNTLLEDPSGLSISALLKASPNRAWADAGTKSLPATIFAELCGTWSLRRTLRSKIDSYPSGTLTGTATITSRAPTASGFVGEMLYSEQGQLTTDQGVILNGSRNYVYRYNRSSDCVSAWFVKPEDKTTVDYLFHQVKFSKLETGPGKILSSCAASGTHLCINDDYNAEYDFRFHLNRLGSWSLRYDVKGPNKDYLADATFERVGESNISDDESIIPLAADQPAGYSGLNRDGDTLRWFCWICPDTILATTIQGRIWKGDLKFLNIEGLENDSFPSLPRTSAKPQVISWTFVDQIQELELFSVVASIRDFALLSGSNGGIYCYRTSTNHVTSLSKLPRKLSGLFLQAIKCPQRTEQGIGVLAACLGAKTISCIIFKAELHKSILVEPIDEQFNLNLPPSFTLTSMCFTETENFLVLGSRYGALCFYDRFDLNRSNNTDPTCCFSNIHGNDSVTMIKDLHIPACSIRSKNESSEVHLLTTGRDGKFSVHRVRVDRKKTGLIMKLETLHTLELPFGPNVEGALFDSVTKDLLLWGFRSTDFVLWNESKQKETMKVECGGCHRSWAFLPNNDGKDGGSFVWTKALTFNVYSQKEGSHLVVQPGSHGREIKAIAIDVQTISGFEDRLENLVATGAEDTNIRILGNCSFGDTALLKNRIYGVISKHTTGIQQLRWSPAKHFLFSAGGREEFFVWHIQPMPQLGVGIKFLAKCPSATDCSELRIMDFAVTEWEENYSKGKFGSEYIIHMVYSDSSVRTWLYDTAKADTGFRMLAVGTYGDCCLTQSTSLITAGEIYLITAGTDGAIAFWNFGSRYQILRSNPLAPNNAPQDSFFENPVTIEWNAKHRIHQSSIKSMTLIAFPGIDDDYILVTGGDDNALAFTRILRAKDPMVSPILSTLLIPRAHASTVTAIQALHHVKSTDNSQHISFHILSASNDQRLKKWSVELDRTRLGVQGLSVEKTGNEYSSVADVSCMDTLGVDESGHERLVLAGIGMEVWNSSV